MLTDTLARIRDTASRMVDCDQTDDGALYLLALDLDTLTAQAEAEADALIRSLRAMHDTLTLLDGMFTDTVPEGDDTKKD